MDSPDDSPNNGREPEEPEAGPDISQDTIRQAIPVPFRPTEELWVESTGVYNDAREQLVDDAVAGIPQYNLVPEYTGGSDTLEALWQHVQHTLQNRHLAFVLLVGEPGLGKSRAIKELAARVAEEGTMRLYGGSGDGGGVAYSAFAHLFARRFDVSPDVGPEGSREQIVRGVSEVLPSARVTEVAHLIAHLMRVPFLDSPVVGPLVSSPQQLETRMFIAVRRFLAADAERSPIVLVIEDLEQCSPETVNLVHYLTAGLASHPVVILGTARSSVFAKYPSFGDGDTPLQTIELAPLSADQATQLIRNLCRPLRDGTPPEIERHALTLGGSPRALLELMRMLLESGVISRSDDEQWVFDSQALADAPLPQGYEGLVARRLEVMEEDAYKRLSMAAVIGETFWLDAVVALSRAPAIDAEHPDGPTLGQIAEYGNRSRTTIMTTLNSLCDNDWILPIEESSVPGEHEYRFAYPHLRKMVLASLHPDERRAYHRSAAQWLELRPEGRRPLAQEDIAHHLQQAGLTVEAALRYRRAADRARRGYFNDRAIVLYLRAINCIGERDPVTRIHLWHDLGGVYELKGDFEAALGAFERMLRLAWVIAARTKAAVAFNKMGRVWRRKGGLELSLEYLQRGAELFDQTGDERGIAGSLDDIGRVLFLLGRYDEAFAKIQAGLERRGRSGDPRSMAQSLSNLGNVQRARGLFAEARECHSEALALRRTSNDRSGVVSSLNNIAVIDFEQGDHMQARSGWVQALSDAGAIGALPLCALVLSNLGELALAERDLDESKRRLEEALSLARDVTDRRLQAEITRNLALVESANGRTDAAKELAQQAIDIAADAGLRDSEGRALVGMGQVLSTSLFDSSRGGEAESAQSFFERGLAIMRELGSEAELARGLEAYGRYRLERDQRERGLAMLREAARLYRKLGMKQREQVEALINSL